MSPAPVLCDTSQVPLESNTGTRHTDELAERHLKDAVRRYYALAELIETERGYVDDLRILVEVYLTSIGAILIPASGPRSEVLPAATPDIAEGTGPAPLHSPTLRSRRAPSSSRPQSHSYDYPPSSFPSSVVIAKEHVEPKPKLRVRPASLQMLSVLQPQHAMRSRRDSGLDRSHANSVKKTSEGLDREVKMYRHVPENGIASESWIRTEVHSRTRSAGFGLDSSGSSGWAGTRISMRRASVDTVPAASKPAHDQIFTGSPESSPHPSPSMSPSVLPSIPSSPVSSQSLSPLPISSHVSQRYLRLRGALTDADRQILARGAYDILRLHERIVQRIEEALGTVQQALTEKKRLTKGKEKPKKADGGDKERDEVEHEVEAAVRAVCGVFAMEAANFKPYEAFCAGHVEAMETARRAMRGHSSDWLDWEKRCAEEAVRQDVDGTAGVDCGADSPLPSPSSPKPVARCGSRNSLLSSIAADAEDAHSSTSTLRRRHSASASSGSLRASASATLKHTKSDPTPPTAGYGHSLGYGHAQGYGLGSVYSALSVKRLSICNDGLYGMHIPGVQDERKRQCERSARTKLSFADYLIKPVQRVCKYPLLFEQLRTPGKRDAVDTAPAPMVASAIEAGGLFATVAASVSAGRDPVPSSEASQKRKNHASFSLGSDSDDEDDEIDLDADERNTEAAIGRVLCTMREVARAVDEAKRRRDLEKKSALIVDRLVAGAPGSGSHVAHALPPHDRDALDDDKGSVEDGRVESHSELGHGVGTASTGTDGAWSTKPPARSLSFSSSFSRSRARSGFGRTNSAFLNHLRKQQQATESGERARRCQVPGPPSRAFLTSLGACLLAGSLDVVVTNIEHTPARYARREGGKHESMLSLAGISTMGSNNGLATTSTFMPPPSREPVKVKYLAAFLYVGGYIMLAKTPKAGVYEPRHWFALTDETIEVVDVHEEKALLPCSFHLVFHATGHRLELAAACQREKEIWLNAMHHARSLPPNWIFEPAPTLNISANLVNSQTSRSSVDVPPVPSIPSMGDDALTQEINPSRMPSNSTLRTEATIKPNRRQSVNGSGVRAFFMNNYENTSSAPSTVLIRRVSATRRAQTDRHLADVLSQPLLSARFHAKAHDEVLFRDPDPPQQGTGIGVGAMAKNKLMARESVLVSKQCAPSICSSLATSADQRSIISESASNATIQGQNQQSTRGKSTKKNTSRSSLSMLLTLPASLIEGNTKDSGMSTPSSQGAFSFDSPLPSTSTTTSIDPLSRSQCSSASTSAPTSSPLNELFPPEVRVVGVDTEPRAEDEELAEVLGHMERPKRSHSLVNNFRVFFSTSRSQSSSPAPSMSSSRQTSVEGSLEVQDAEGTPQWSVFSRIMKSTSLRTRGRSASNVLQSIGTASSSGNASVVQDVPNRPSFLSRSSSMLAIPRRKPIPSTRVTAKTVATSSPSQNSTSLASLGSRASRSSITSTEARNQKTLSRAIKYRLFPGSLLPLTPADDGPHDRTS